MRLQKYLASCGAASRRKAEELISAGRVTVNGAVAEIGQSVDENSDTICLDGRQITLNLERTYIMLHKPTGYVTTLRDTHGRPTVAELVSDAGVRLFPVGRLDIMSEGLLIMTDDGQIANKLSHPSHGVEKTYRVWVSGDDVLSRIDDLSRPLEYKGVPYAGGKVRVIHSSGKKAAADLTITEGKNREVRNMCAAAGLHVDRLMRISQGELKLGDLPAGEWRYLSQKEIVWLTQLK